jgi:predicted 3-demethylubiquinone-9 3-methyltransferase (glyoxalase superfamily)
MLNLTPFLIFDGKCAEAMAFYQSCLGGELTVTRLGDTPMGDQAPPEQRQKVRYGVHWFFRRAPQDPEDGVEGGARWPIR